MSRNSRLLPALLAIAIALPIAAHAAALPTVTTLTLSSSSVSWHKAVRLTAQVTAGGAPVTGGTVTFCDLSGPYTRCEDSAIVGKAQITRCRRADQHHSRNRHPQIYCHFQWYQWHQCCRPQPVCCPNLDRDRPLSHRHVDCSVRQSQRLSADSHRRRFLQPAAYALRHCVFSRHKQRQPGSGNSLARPARPRCRDLSPGDRFPHPHRQPARRRRQRRLQR